MKAKSIKGTSPAEIKTGLDKCMQDGFKPTLAFVFMSIKQDIDSVRQVLMEHHIQIFGATTGGEFIDGDIGAGSIAILLVDMNPAHFRVLLQDYRDKDTQEVAREIATLAKKTFENPSIIISVSADVRGESGPAMEDPVVKSIESVTGKNIILWGGRAGDDFDFHETVVFNHEFSTKRGILLLVLDGDKVLVRGEAASGQKAMGTERVVTKVVGKWVYEIDHQPAAEIVLKFLGLHLTPEEAQTYYPKEAIVFSVARDQGDPVLRGLGVFDWNNKSFLPLGDIHEGDRIRLTIAPDFEVIEEVRQKAEKIKQEELPEVDALLMFSCIGRLGQFGPLVGEEIDGVRNVFNVPMAGFFTYGEFGRTTNGNNEFHANTCCWVALKEK
ncbi:hypothetical protein D0X99_00345 [Algoriphagus lacus]|uniref:Histidine kinase n=1 Tax=Algoriphagus lacus TaxID=2056311 RepID=A0A418PVV9_9BACT|nr:FIST N-terminal domain-containing protein [Algoriphagus lacus]RIW18186.1 hypothetical protein D0X99_00345 [Algoriphagus lacus]